MIFLFQKKILQHSLPFHSKYKHFGTSLLIPLYDSHQSLCHQHKLFLFFTKPLFYMAEPYMSMFRLWLSYKNMTSPYGLKKPPTWNKVWIATDFSHGRKKCPLSIQIHTNRFFESLRGVGFLGSKQNRCRHMFSTNLIWWRPPSFSNMRGMPSSI